jgi:hypothetical protein
LNSSSSARRQVFASEAALPPRHVCKWHIADIDADDEHVRFWR